MIIFINIESSGNKILSENLPINSYNIVATNWFEIQEPLFKVGTLLTLKKDNKKNKIIIAKRLPILNRFTKTQHWFYIIYRKCDPYILRFIQEEELVKLKQLIKNINESCEFDTAVKLEEAFNQIKTFNDKENFFEQNNEIDNSSPF